MSEEVPIFNDNDWLVKANSRMMQRITFFIIAFGTAWTKTREIQQQLQKGAVLPVIGS